MADLVTEDVAIEAGEAEEKVALGDGNDGIKLVVGEQEKSRRRRDTVEAEPEKTDEQFPDVQGVSLQFPENPVFSSFAKVLF